MSSTRDVMCSEKASVFVDFAMPQYRLTVAGAHWLQSRSIDRVADRIRVSSKNWLYLHVDWRIPRVATNVHGRQLHYYTVAALGLGLEDLANDQHGCGDEYNGLHSVL